MRHFATFTIALAAMIAVPSLQAQDKDSGKSGEQAQAKAADVQIPRTISGKRQWLREQAVKGIEDPRKAREIQRAVDRMSVAQMNEAIQGVLAQQLPANADAQQAALLAQQAQLELARAQALRQYLEYLVWVQQGRVGYAPVITWLPEGTQFGANAVISPDGRYARINTAPFFSSIGPVYTYNLNTGETRLQQPYPYQDPYGPRYTNPNAQNSGYNGGIPSWHLPQRPQNPNPPASNSRPQFRG